ncbi:MAG: ferritin family protein [Planctomycetota bacterium]|jgi:rubrerythrin
MEKFDSIEAILDFAISEEKGAQKFYLELAQKVDNPAIKKALEDFAKEEAGHQAKLEKIKAGGKLQRSGEQVSDLKIADYLVDVEPSVDMDYQSVLTIAMKKEKAAFKLYSQLAAQTADPEIKEVFLSLAQEEAKHKLRFELEYDEEILKED